MTTTPRFTEFFGYSAETSAPNETPKWGHLTATFADQIQERFEKWLVEHDSDVAKQTLIATADAIDCTFELVDLEPWSAEDAYVAIENSSPWSDWIRARAESGVL